MTRLLCRVAVFLQLQRLPCVGLVVCSSSSNGSSSNNSISPASTQQRVTVQSRCSGHPTAATHSSTMLLRHGSRCLCSGVGRPTAAAPTWRHATSRAPSTATHAAAVGGQQQQLEGLMDQSREPSSSSSLEAASTDGEVPEFPTMQLQLPPPTHSQIKVAEFVKSSVDVKDCPPPKYPEFAVIGRSNVGKSSLINLLTNRKSLAMVSKQPGEGACCGICPSVCCPKPSHMQTAAQPGALVQWMQLGMPGQLLLSIPVSPHSLVPPCALACTLSTCRQDALHQPLCHQQQLVPRGPARLRVRSCGASSNTHLAVTYIGTRLYACTPCM